MPNIEGRGGIYSPTFSCFILSTFNSAQYILKPSIKRDSMNKLFFNGEREIVVLSKNHLHRHWSEEVWGRKNRT